MTVRGERELSGEWGSSVLRPEVYTSSSGVDWLRRPARRNPLGPLSHLFLALFSIALLLLLVASYSHVRESSFAAEVVGGASCSHETFSCEIWIKARPDSASLSAMKDDRVELTSIDSGASIPGAIVARDPVDQDHLLVAVESSDLLVGEVKVRATSERRLSEWIWGQSRVANTDRSSE